MVCKYLILQGVLMAKMPCLGFFDNLVSTSGIALIDISFHPGKMGLVDKAKPSVMVGGKATGFKVPIGV